MRITSSHIQYVYAISNQGHQNLGDAKQIMHVY